MDFVFPIAGGLSAACALWFLTGQQHHFYTNPAHRVRQNRRQDWVRRAGISLVSGGLVATALRPNHYDLAPALATAAFVVLLLLLASTDIERRLLPNRLTYPGIVAAAAVCWLWPDREPMDIALGTVIVLGIGVVFFVLGIALSAALGIRTTAFGLGDVKLMLLIALLLGWPAVMSALFIGVIAAGVPALVMVVAGKSRGVFSYGPFLVAGAIVPLLWPSGFV